ncbi:polymerase [Mucilaginibacter sp.]|uniref:polymerase n=1 Tax=Mucilaginibacter sp. TaxID=1882438 RepID=UPI00261327EE|nr:polymerase [Mucilaginibacter sp.]MDB4925699.1 hypothetical protein [Mucilaginibacter sp.]
MRKLLAFLIIISITASFSPVFGQNIIPRFIRHMYFNKDTSKQSSFIIIPVLTSSPETGIEAGGAGLFSFYTDTVHLDTRVSSIFGYATATTKGQTRTSLNINYWTSENKYHFTAYAGYTHFPFDFYGIGNNTAKANSEHIDEKRYKLTFGAEKRVGSDFYIGIVGGDVNFKYKNNNPGGIFDTDPQIENRTGGAFIYIGPSFNYDTRNNNTYTTKGMTVTAYFNAMQGIFGNNSYTGGFLNIEYAQFFALNKQLVLGVDVQEQSLTGGRSPFYLLPALGSDEMMRGYYNGRYRDRNFIAGQTELRYRINQRFGVVGFVGTGEVFHTMFSAAQLKPNYGGGARYFFDIEKGLSVRLDYGVGQKPVGEQRESGFYVGLGQAF